MWLVGCVALALTASGCGFFGGDESAAEEGGLAAPIPRKVQLAIAPSHGAKDVRPDSPVSVWASNGRLSDVVVRGPGNRKLSGSVASRGSVWRADEPLNFGSRYTVQATAVGSDGKAVAQTASFRTVKPKSRVDYDIAPMPNETVGVGMPIILYFDQPVREKAAVERRLAVQTSRPVQGAWHWFSDEELHFRPRTFWRPGTKVTVHAPLYGAPIRPGVWGDKNTTVSFRVGPRMINNVNLDTHNLRVKRDGKLLRSIPVSGGKAGWETRSGTKVIMEMLPVHVMDAASIGVSSGSSEYYRLTVRYAMRVTWSGEFLHAAPWSVADQGSANVSHGCVGMSTSNARWLFNRTNRGDVVNVTGTNEKIEKGNGFTDWEMSWAQYKKGSALS